MDQVLVFRIDSLHARSVQENGLKFRYRGRDFSTGPIVTQLDSLAAPVANVGLINLTSGAIAIQWAITVAFPFLADAFSAGYMSKKDAGTPRITLEESGRVLEDGSGFSVKGTGQVFPGSVFSQARILSHANLVKIPVAGPSGSLKRALGADFVACTFAPDSSHLDVKLPKSFGGGTQRLNLVGGFSIVPVMALPAANSAKGVRR